MRFIFLSTRNPLFPSLFFGVTQSGKPVRIRMYHVEFVAAAQVFVFVLFGKHIIAVQSEPESPGLHTPYPALRGSADASMPRSGNDGGIIMVLAVALRRYVHNETDMEVRLVFQHGNGIFCNLVVQPFGRIPVAHYGGVVLAQSYALSASHTFGIVISALRSAFR